MLKQMVMVTGNYEQEDIGEMMANNGDTGSTFVSSAESIVISAPRWGYSA